MRGHGEIEHAYDVGSPKKTLSNIKAMSEPILIRMKKINKRQ